MAEMIPDRMPSGSSVGEKRMFEVLSRLPEDCLVYYEPVIQRKYPDFVVIIPQLGLLVIEVKGWRLGEIVSATTSEVHVRIRGEEQVHVHPVRQARSYMYCLMDRCREHAAGRPLIRAEEPWLGRFYFPFTHFAVLSNVTDDQLMAADPQVLEVFPPEKCVTRSRLARWLGMEADDLLAQLVSTFDVRWDFPRMPDNHVHALRAMIHPQIVIAWPKESDEPPAVDLPPPESPDTGSARQPSSLKVLDCHQERHALSIGEGHRILYGVAGSGKTVILVSRARWLAGEDPARQILLLCYNVSLSAYLRACLHDLPSVRVLHFDGWAKQCGLARRMGEADDSLGVRFLAHLQDGKGDSSQVQCILIDEAQDFAPEWFRCALAALEDPDDGDLVIVGDASQGLYRREQISWKSLGIHAQGRTTSARFDLDRNYRNTREILTLAAVLLADATGAIDDDSIQSLRVNPEVCERSGPRPLHLRGADRAEEAAHAAALVDEVLSGKISRGNGLERPSPDSIGILYPRLERKSRPILQSLLVELEKRTGVSPLWLSDPARKVNRGALHLPGVRVQTIHSAKGLQYSTVIVLWADLLPSGFTDSDSLSDRRLLYVALTRAEDLLAITSSRASPFIDELLGSGALDTPGSAVRRER